MPHRSRLRSAAWPALCLAGVLLLAACGSGSGDAADDSTATRPAVVSAQVDEPGNAGTDAGGGGAAELCDDNQEPNGLDYTVASIPADDPDGGLLLLDDAGVGNAQLAILPSGTPVITTNDPATCAVVADGGVWWKVRSEDGVRGWVNSRHLGRSAGQVAAGTAEICRLYAEVLAYENGPGDFAPGGLTAELDAALNGPPPGVSDALRRISSPSDGADLVTAYASLKGYVGQICP